MKTDHLEEKRKHLTEKRGQLLDRFILSRDGFVRFIRLDQHFEIEISEEGVE